MFSTELGLTLEAAFREASSRRHAFFCLEHLLYALTFDEQIIEVLQNAGVELALLRKDLEAFFDKHVEVVPTRAVKGVTTEPAQTPAVQRVLQPQVRIFSTKVAVHAVAGSTRKKGSSSGHTEAGFQHSLEEKM